MSSSTTPHRPISRPTTPLRASSRSSLRESGRGAALTNSEVPLETFERPLSEFSDSMADLEANFMHLQLMHESLARFSENFASFLYGLNMNAFCVDFPEVSKPGDS
jgi:DASH complex subunit DAM1